jgi:uncharacterized protein YjbI with pentapeptide repeats
MKDVNALFELFCQCNGEAMAMRWRKRELLKAGIVVAGMLLLLVLMTWVPVSATRAYEGVSELATPGTVTVAASPTEDATVTALNKEKLAQEVQQLKEQNAPDLFGWLRANAAILLSTLVVVIGGLIGLFRWLGDRRDEQTKRREDQRSEQEKRAEEQKRWLEDRQAEREKRAEERFQAAVEGLGNDNYGVKVGAAILLRTFLQPGYEQFYRQAFDLAVVHLRLRKADPSIPEPVDSLSQALITVLRESFSLARDGLGKQLFQSSPQTLDATGVQLDHAYLSQTDLRGIWMPGAHLQGAHLWKTDLRDAIIQYSNLGGAYLKEANLQLVHLWRTDLTGADLTGADLTGAGLREANLTKADLTDTNLEDARSLKDTNLHGVKGLTQEQLAACKAKGAIIDEDPLISSFQSTISSPLLPQSNDAQASSAPPEQGNVPLPDTGGSSAASSQQDPES